MLGIRLLPSLVGTLLVVLSSCGTHSAVVVVPIAAVVPHDQWSDEQDHALAIAIRSDLDRDSLVSAHANLVSIAVAQGNVTLTGTMPSVVMKAQAGVRARWLAGLDHVDNALAVEPPSTSVPAAP